MYNVLYFYSIVGVRQSCGTPNAWISSYIVVIAGEWILINPNPDLTVQFSCNSYLEIKLFEETQAVCDTISEYV